MRSACRLWMGVSGALWDVKVMVYRWNMIHCDTLTILSWDSLSVDSFAFRASSVKAMIIVMNV
jgi:hypothetical protein